MLLVVVLQQQLTQAQGGTKLSGNFFLIAGAFSSESNARNRVRQLKNDGYSSAGMVGQNEKGYYLVAYKGFSSRSQAESYMPQIKRKRTKYLDLSACQIIFII